MRSDTPVSNSGSTSFANPGSMPEVKKDDLPLAHASSSGAVKSGSAPAGWTSGTSELDTTFFPDARIADMSCSASTGRRSPVAV